MDVGAQQRVVAVGASAGGVKALVRLAAALRRDLGHAVMVLHMPAGAPPSQLARILDRSGPLPPVWAAHGDLIETGRTGRRGQEIREGLVDIGTFDDGTPTQLSGSQGRILVTGPAQSGKSYLVGLMAEQWILAGYCVVVFDPEGDHTDLQELNQVQVVDARHYLPEPTELVNTLLHPHTSIVVDLSGLAEPEKIDYLHRLRSTTEAHREEHGFPHWVIYDEAHLLGTHEEVPWIRRGGYVLSSFAPKSLPANEIDSTDIVLKLTTADTATEVTSRTTRRATVRFGSGPSRPFTLADRRTTHVRHRHKYADVALPKERRFYFQAIDGQSVPAAATMHDFRTALTHLNPQALQYHLERGDFSRWLEGTIADKDLAAQVAAWEDELLAHSAAHLERIRHQLVRAVEQRYPQW
ncbi:MAG: chemotaxis protein CheB [Mycobacterium sp.]